MAHPEREAVEADAVPGDPLDEIAKFLDDEPEEPEAPEGEEAEEDDPEEGELDEEQDDGEEPEEPAIQPPVSLNKEQKAAFAQLPPELQKVWAETEAQRNREVQIKTTEAAEARRNAATEAKAELAQIQRQYADELAIYANAFQPQRPDPSLLATNPALYAQEQAYYEQALAQHQQLMQQVQSVRQNADGLDAETQQALTAREAQALKQAFPEWFDPAQGPELHKTLTDVALELGYSPEIIPEATAADILAIRKAHDWKVKAEKWDAFQARKMQNVRAAKALPKVAKPGNAPSRTQSNASRADAAWQRVQKTRSGDDFADFLEARGVSL